MTGGLIGNKDRCDLFEYIYVYIFIYFYLFTYIIEIFVYLSLNIIYIYEYAGYDRSNWWKVTVAFVVVFFYFALVVNHLGKMSLKKHVFNHFSTHLKH